MAFTIRIKDSDGAAAKPPVVVDKPEEDPKDPEKEPPVQIPKLASHQIDIPEEPEEVQVITTVWDPEGNQWVEKDLGKLLLVPTGCDDCEELSPYETIVSFKSALPRDKEKDANLYQAYKNMHIVSREWVRENVDEEIDGEKEDKRIADDIPIELAAQGIPETGGVAQTPGIDPGGAAQGSNNGAPLPPKPGPGRGNKIAPGDNLASGAPPANAVPGTTV